MKLKEAYQIISNYDSFLFYNFEKQEIKFSLQRNSIIYLDDTNCLTKHNQYKEKLPKILMDIE